MRSHALQAKRQRTCCWVGLGVSVCVHEITDDDLSLSFNMKVYIIRILLLLNASTRLGSYGPTVDRPGPA